MKMNPANFNNNRDKKYSSQGLGFYLIQFLLFFDYIRPQSDLPFLKPLRIPMLLIIILAFLGCKNNLWSFKEISTKAFMVLILVGFIYIPFAVNNFYAFEMTRMLLIYFLTYMSIISFVDTQDKIKRMTYFWLFIGVFCSIKGIFHGGEIPGSGFLGDENDFALFLVMMLPVALINLVLRKNSIITTFFLISSLFFLSIGIVVSFSRGGFIALVSVLLYCWLIMPKKILFLVLLFCATAISMPILPTEYKAEIETIFKGAEESTAGERIYSWKCGIEMFKDYPVFGVGPGNFPWRFAEYEPQEKYHGRSHGGRAAHSLYFTLIPEFGITGIICFSIMIFSPLKKIYKINKSYHPGGYNYSKNYANTIISFKTVFGALISFLFAGVFLSVLYYPHFWIICAILISICRVLEREIKISQVKL